MNSVQIGILVVQILGLVVLFWYAWETSVMRKAAQEQVKASQELLKAAMDQVEGLSKPCLTLSAELRDPANTILEMDGAVGGTMACTDDGNFVVQNIGNGVALNVRYSFEKIDPPDGKTRTSDRYLLSVLANQRVRMPEPVAAYRGECELVFRFHSIGGREYQSTVKMNNRVLTAFRSTQV